MQEAFEIGLLTILVKLSMLLAAEDALAIEKSFHDSDVDQFDDFLLQEGLLMKNIFSSAIRILSSTII